MDLSYSWQAIAVQLAAYSRADAIYRQGPAPERLSGRAHSDAAVDQERG